MKTITNRMKMQIVIRKLSMSISLKKNNTNKSLIKSTIIKHFNSTKEKKRKKRKLINGYDLIL